MSVDISVIIPAYNAAKTIGKTLDALSRQDYSGTYEVIVVDDGSTDGTSAAVRSYTNVRCLSQPNAGPAAARNHGARSALGKVLAFTDSDCVPHRDWLLRLSAGLQSPEVAAVAGSYGIANPQSLLASCIHAEILFRHEHLMPDHPKSFGSYNFCARKEVFWRAGGFNEGYRHASGEDNDLSYKIQQAGGRIYFARKALVDHHHPTEVLRYLKEQFRHGFWRVKMYADHQRMARGDNYTYWKDMAEVPWSLGCLLGLVLSIWGHGDFNAVMGFLSLSLFVFEFISARCMTKNFFGMIYFSFILFLRAFARSIGLSTGILWSIREKIGKIFK